MGRTASTERKTKETSVSVRLDLDGSGEYDIDCPVSFMRHMLETLSRYSETDMRIKASGDDDHHIVEDIAITLGTAFRKALDGTPVHRMSSQTVAMDDALVMTSVDIIDRPYADIECPDTLYAHFMRSFAMSAGMTIHTLIYRGTDEHHIIEAMFKSLGMCIRDSVRARKSELSTKDSVELR